MDWDFRNLSTGEEVTDPLAATVPLSELRREHAVRYVMQTSKGIIILRHMPLRMHRMIEAARHAIYPETARMEKEARELLPYFQGIPEDEVDPEAKKRLMELSSQLQLTDMGALGVVVAPALASMEDYEALYESLDEKERLQLATAVRELSTPIPPERVDAAPLEIAKANGIRLMTEEELECLTVSQAAFWCDRIAQEARRTEAAMRRMQRRRRPWSWTSWGTSTCGRRRLRRSPPACRGWDSTPVRI